MGLVEITRKNELDAVKAWRDADVVERKVFGLVGPAGVGKTTALAQVCKTQEVVASYFFKYNDCEAASVRTCLFSIARQLEQVFPDFQMLNEDEFSAIGDISTLFRLALVKPLHHVSKKQGTGVVVVVLDAIDEAEEREELEEIVSEKWTREMPHWVGLCVSFRTSSSKLRDVSMHQMLCDSTENQEDLKTAARIAFESLMVEKDHATEAARVVARNSEGFWPFANSLVDALTGGKDTLSLVEFCENILNVSENICDTVFRDYFSRFRKEADYSEYTKLFSVLAVSRQEVPPNLLAIVLNEVQDIEKFLERASGFLTRDRFGAVRFLHRNMGNFLLSRKRAGVDLHIPASLGHEQLAAAMLFQDKTSKIACYDLVYHLGQGQNWDGVRDLMFDFDWLCTCVKFQVLKDVNNFSKELGFADTQVTQVARALEFCQPDLLEQPELLLFDLLGRIPDKSHPVFTSCRNSIILASRSNPNDGQLLPSHACLRQDCAGARRLFDSVLAWYPGGVASSPKALHGDLAVMHEVSSLEIWNRRVGVCLRVLPEMSHVQTCAINDSFLAVSYNDQVKVWDWKQGTCLHVFDDPRCYYTLKLFGKRLIGTSTFAGIREWNLETGRCVRKTSLKYDCFFESAIGEDMLALFLVPYGIVETRSQKGKALRKWNVNGDHIALDGDMVVTGSRAGIVQVWDGRKGELLYALPSLPMDSVSLQGHVVTSHCWDPDFVWDLNVLSSKYTDPCTAVAFSTEEGKIVSGTWNGVIRISDIWTGADSDVAFEGAERSQVLAIGFYDEEMFAAFKNGAVQTWNKNGGPGIRKFQVTETRKRKGHFFRRNKEYQILTDASSDGHVLATLSEDNSVSVWDVRTQIRMQMFTNDPPSQFANSHRYRSTLLLDGDTLAFSLEKRTDVVDWQSRNLLDRLDHNVAIAAKGNLVVYNHGGQPIVWDRLARRKSRLQLDESRKVHHNALAVAIWNDIFWTTSRSFARSSILEWRKNEEGVFMPRTVAELDGCLTYMTVQEISNSRLCMACLMNGMPNPIVLWRNI